MKERRGLLLAFEGLDQSGKETLACRLERWLRSLNVSTQQLAFPDYTTPIGNLIQLYLAGRLDFDSETRQLLFVTNRCERLSDIEHWLATGVVVITDRYVGSGIAYGMAHGLDFEWLQKLEMVLPKADKTFLVDIPVETSFSRKTKHRNRYETQTALLERARQAYLDLASLFNWIVLDGSKPLDALSQEVFDIIDDCLRRRSHCKSF